MTHYNENPGIVRCDVFKDGGKWYETIAIDMSEYFRNTLAPFDAVILALDDAGHYKIGDWNFVVAEPYHANAYPIMVPHGVDREEMLRQARHGMEYMKNK